jgi:hypothetical protein
MFFFRASILIFLFGICFDKSGYSQPVQSSCPAGTYAELTQRVLSFERLSPLWYDSSIQSIRFRATLVHCIDSLYRLGLIAQPYHDRITSTLHGQRTATPGLVAEPSCYIEAIVATSFDLYRGSDRYTKLGFDAVSPRYRLRDDSLIEAGVRAIDGETKLRRWLFSLEPKKKEYSLLRSYFLEKQGSGSAASRSLAKKDTLQRLETSLHLYRWLFHFEIDRFLMVNIPGALLNYYQDGVSTISMRAIVGKSSTPTPRFASYCHRLILYPYWYVPASIAIGEYLSNIKKNPGWLDHRNMQLVDGQGRVVDHHRLNWRSFHAGYFPYTIRQSTGCDNALGVLKFDIETPYGVYLHDTNNKGAFLRPSRFLSHGCIRLEEPLLLGSRLLGGGLDTAYLQSCFYDKKPIFRPLSEPVAVFSLYWPASVEPDGRIQFWPDPYFLMGKRK